MLLLANDIKELQDPVLKPFRNRSLKMEPPEISLTLNYARPRRKKRSELTPTSDEVPFTEWVSWTFNHNRWPPSDRGEPRAQSIPDPKTLCVTDMRFQFIELLFIFSFSHSLPLCLSQSRSIFDIGKILDQSLQCIVVKMV